MKKRVIGIISILALAALIAVSTIGVIHAETSADTPRIWFETSRSAGIGQNTEFSVNVRIAENPGIVSLTLPVVWDTEELALVSVQNTDGVVPGWYGSTDVEAWDGRYYLAWNNDTHHDGSFGKAEFSEDGILCTMVFKSASAQEISDLTLYVDEEDPLAGIMNWDMEDHLHKNENDGIYGDENFQFTPGLLEKSGGDLNGDGKVNAIDAVYLLNHVSDADEYPVEENADYNGDGSVTAADAAYLLWHLVLPEKYPVEDGKE